MVRKTFGRNPNPGIAALLLFLLLSLTLIGPVTVRAVEAVVPGENVSAVKGQVSAGLLHSLIVQLDGHLYAMGDNQFGQLGIVEESDRTDPVLVNLPEKTIQVSAGAYHSLVLTESGKVWAFGRNAFGQLGTGTTENQSTPKFIDSLPKAVALASGAYHSLILTEDGSVYAFGDQTYGQCGPALSEPVQNEKGESVSRRVIRPQRIVDSNAVAIAAGAAHSLVLLSDGQVLAFGDNRRGQLGNGTTNTQSGLSTVPGISGASRIAAGGDHSLIVSDNNQTLWAFGDNSLGQTGTGSDFGPQSMVLVPTAVDWKKGARRGTYVIADVYAGYGNSALVVTRLDQGAEDPRDTKILLWGSNAYGQLGAGSSGSRALPQTLMTLDQGYEGDRYLPIESLAIGNGHILIWSSRGLIGSAGRNDNGQAGQPTGGNPARFANIALPPFAEPMSVEGIDGTAPTASSLKGMLWGDRLTKDGYSLALQVPWDTIDLPDHGVVQPKFDIRILFLIGSGLLILLAAGLVIRYTQKRKVISKSDMG